MTLRTIRLFGTGFPAQSRTVTTQKRTNLFIVPEKDPDKSGFHLTCTPGLTLFANVSDYPSRGAISINGFIYTVHGSKLHSINPFGGVADRQNQLYIFFASDRMQLGVTREDKIQF